MPEQQQQQQQQGGAVRPDLIVMPDGRRVFRDDSYLPAFPMVVETVDRHAKRFPWWVWALFGFALGSGFLSKMWKSRGARSSGDY